MKDYQSIHSKDNTVFKQYRQVSAPKSSKKSDYFLIEGIREIALAVSSGIQLKSIVFKASDHSSQNALFSLIKSPSIPLHYFSSDLFMRLAIRKSGDNALALAKRPSTKISNGQSAVVMVLENIEKPGNLGAIARSADALGLKDIILTETSINVYNPNVIRASLGAIFALNITAMSNEECVKYLRQNHYNIIVTDLESNLDYRKANYSDKSAIVMGSESHGISDLWRQAADQKVIIPMVGQVNSLNLSVSSAIMMTTILKI